MNSVIKGGKLCISTYSGYGFIQRNHTDNRENRKSLILSILKKCRIIFVPMRT